MKQFLITPAAGKRLIAKALTKHPAIENALKSGTIVIIAGTTNGYVAEEILTLTGQSEDFSKKRFLQRYCTSTRTTKNPFGQIA